MTLALTWIAGGAIATGLALGWLPSAWLDGAWTPTTHDSFYHARRILDAVANPNGFYEFDPAMNAPEGGRITWPWAYDLALAWLVRVVLLVPGVSATLAARASSWLSYVLVRRQDNVLDPDVPAEEVVHENAGLRAELLRAGDVFPPAYELLQEVRLARSDGSVVVVARLFRLRC